VHLLGLDVVLWGRSLLSLLLLKCGLAYLCLSEELLYIAMELTFLGGTVVRGDI